MLSVFKFVSVKSSLSYIKKTFSGLPVDLRSGKTAERSLAEMVSDRRIPWLARKF